MKELYDKVSVACSKITTRSYSTSFSLGIHFLHKDIHNAIYSIYGFVRFADEIVDSFHEHDKKLLLEEFEEETWKAIDRGISINPILNSFQQVVNEYQIDRELIECFLESMKTDLEKTAHCHDSYSRYILGSAEVVGLMCLHIFTEKNKTLYNQLKQPAMKLGAAFQKVNFLRDLKNDYGVLGRVYFPGIDFSRFSETEKTHIAEDIKEDFSNALYGIALLPKSSRLGVYIAYSYYQNLFHKILNLPANAILTGRVRISNTKKIMLMLVAYSKHKLGMIGSGEKHIPVLRRRSLRREEILATENAEVSNVF